METHQNNALRPLTAPTSDSTRQPRSIARTIIFWLLIAGAIAASIIWIHWFPLHEDRLYSVIPPEATVIVEHRDLAARWPEISRNPLIRALVEFTASAHGYPLNGAFDDPATAWWIEQLAGRHAVLAYTPRLTGTVDDAWIMASWVGRFSHQMRWSLAWDRSGSVRTISLGNGERGWVIADPAAHTDTPVLSLALVDGVLIAGWSKNPYAAQVFSGRKKWGADPAEALRDKIIRQQQGRPRHPSWETAPDRGWIRSLFPIDRRQPARPLRVALTAITPDSLTGRLEPEQILDVGNDGIDLGHAEFLHPLEHILGNSPATLAALPFESVNRHWLQPSNQRMLQTLGVLLSAATDPNAPCFIALSRPPYDGRVLGFRTPGILLGLYLDDPESGRRLVASLLDVVNAEMGLSLIPKNETGSTGQPVFVVEGVNTGAFLQLAPAERPAFTVTGNWLLLALNRSMIEQLPLNNATASAGTSPTAWRQAAARSPTSAWLWMDFAATHTAVSQAKAVHGLLSHITRFPADHAIGQALDALAIFTEAAKPLESGILATDDAKPNPGMIFTLGK